MRRDLDTENALKAAQAAQLLLQDLQDLHRSGDAMLAMLVLPEIERVASVRDHLGAIVLALRDQHHDAQTEPVSTEGPMQDSQHTRADLEKVVPFADEDSIGCWDDVPAAIEGMNTVIAVIHAEHPCSTQVQLDNAAWLGNAAYEEFCRADGDVEKTIDYVRSRMEGQK